MAATRANVPLRSAGEVYAAPCKKVTSRSRRDLARQVEAEPARQELTAAMNGAAPRYIHYPHRQRTPKLQDRHRHLDQCQSRQRGRR
jgi:hypothetical protein